MLIRKVNNKPLKNRNRALGLYGENLAARFLASKGYKIIGRNVKTFVGEIDIVARKKSLIVFAEIKTRKNESFGAPYLSITEKKKRKLAQCALCYLKMKNISNTPWQIDVVSMEVKHIFWFINRIKIEHFENAIEE